jgi:hypothetical protein
MCLHICTIAVAWPSDGGSITCISRKKAMKFATCPAITLSLVCAPPWTIPAFPADDGIPVNRARYADHPVLPDFTAPACPDNPRGLEQVKGNLYRHTTGAGLAVHSGLVLATGEGAQRQLHTQSKLGCPQMPELPPWNPAASQRLL